MSRGVLGLAAAAGVDFPHIAVAQERTRKGLEERSRRLSSLDLSPSTGDASVVLTGSWGRHEATRDSDDDFIVLFELAPPENADAVVQGVHDALGGGHVGEEGVFGRHASLSDLLGKIGRDEDSNTNLTRRMLLILESVPVAGEVVHLRARRSLLAGYLDAHMKDYRPPRFLLNDLVRYWRTIAVDFESKMRARQGDGWGLRNAKLRLSRKALFAGGLLPVLECYRYGAESMLEHLDGRMSVPPLDRLADAFRDHDALDPGVRALGAYDAFLEVLNDPDKRALLSALTHDQRHDSELFQRITELGQEFEAGLLALLFDDAQLRRWVREYLIF
ncbi:MAG: hypothetical protein J2O48_04535 [Solirubrobacterales bacterium]|nr:hypothetical protein [Solirubrobacterales bacterium]